MPAIGYAITENSFLPYFVFSAEASVLRYLILSIGADKPVPGFSATTAGKTFFSAWPTRVNEILLYSDKILFL